MRCRRLPVPPHPAAGKRPCGISTTSDSDEEQMYLEGATPLRAAGVVAGLQTAPATRCCYIIHAAPGSVNSFTPEAPSSESNSSLLNRPTTGPQTPLQAASSPHGGPQPSLPGCTTVYSASSSCSFTATMQPVQCPLRGPAPHNLPELTGQPSQGPLQVRDRASPFQFVPTWRTDPPKQWSCTAKCTSRPATSPQWSQPPARSHQPDRGKPDGAAALLSPPPVAWAHSTGFMRPPDQGI
ncbi:hypothetical protein NDU88_004571 [Pleurodeles waltl]|uniref:Uncharacterized protein n=1 Tax=Pleurodeles waltl TaxID=8319 RepID=A0AAV7TRR3_PLEWA|nr:hypothetical protein NDU88_004571 [Pleurodeles waltl]